MTLSDAACASSSSLPDGLAYVAEGPLAKGDLGRVIGDDGSRCRPWQVRVNGGWQHSCSVHQRESSCRV